VGFEPKCQAPEELLEPLGYPLNPMYVIIYFLIIQLLKKWGRGNFEPEFSS